MTELSKVSNNVKIVKYCQQSSKIFKIVKKKCKNGQTYSTIVQKIKIFVKKSNIVNNYLKLSKKNMYQNCQNIDQVMFPQVFQRSQVTSVVCQK